ncbi:unnamed protein product [Chrysodeixis includens]|uniref:MADF domain-containing protein n=1 Tax=Chrysodeixis includens TaxID=689277 RepID=A0A9P0BVM9_CHRIL|nr:unnamed protein product [Chrysodeixis includens]
MLAGKPSTNAFPKRLDKPRTFTQLDAQHAHRLCLQVGAQNVPRGPARGGAGRAGAGGCRSQRAPPNTLSDLRDAPLDERAMTDTLNVVFPRKLLKEFITLYKNLPCLWDKNCVSYKMKVKRHEAVTKLTQLVQTYDHSATRVHVLRKIESLRACVRREFKKVQDSKATAANEDEVYTPHLWYYELFSFMFNDDMNETSFTKNKHRPSPVPTVVDSEGDDDERPFEPSIDTYSTPEYTVTSNMIDVPESSSNKRFSTLEDDKNKRHCTEVEDEYDAIGKDLLKTTD